MKTLIMVLMVMVCFTFPVSANTNSNPGCTVPFEGTVEQEPYVYLKEFSVANIVCRICDARKTEQIDIVFVLDDNEPDKAYIFISINDELDENIDDYMLVFEGENPQAFPLERYTLGDSTRELFCQLKREDLKTFIYELEHGNNRIVTVKLTSAHDQDREWIFYPDLIPAASDSKK